MSEYKKGDRVKVTFEGQVTHVDSLGIRVIDPDNANLFAWVLPNSVEKLVPPQPKWVYGAVVKVPGFFPFWFYSGKWKGTGRQCQVDDFTPEVHEAWNDGTLEILWNGDSDD